jgi:uncharacterized protein (DUF1501 family)
MKRRDFLKMSSMATLALSVNGLPIHAFGQEGKHSTRNSNGKVLVLVRLSGGNDGLNTIIPLDKYAELTYARPDVLIPNADVLPLNGTNSTGLHPSMTALQNMYNNGKVNIVQGVSYPNPNYSHFRASDIYSSASDANLFVNSGWIGRFAEEAFPGSPAAYPNATFLDPLSIEIGYQASSIIVGTQGLNGFTVSNLDYFYNIANGIVEPAPNTRGGHELTYVRFIAQQTQAYTGRIEAASLAGTNSATYPANNYLADQLKIVAKLISGGLQTPVYIVTIDGFDTHDTQVEASNHSIGQHADLLGNLSNAIGAFQADLEAQNLDNKVVGLTFSEFGRRIISNASNGTDHGEAAPMIVFGSAVNPTIIGNSPNIPTAATVDDSVPMQHDFRSIYSTILTDWFNMSPSSVNNIMNGSSYQWLPIFNNTPLPILLKSFIADVSECLVTLTWESENETNASYFEVMYSKDNTEFKSIGKVGVNGVGSTYHFKHSPESDMAFYQLKMIDVDAKIRYSQVVKAMIRCATQTIRVYPNPANEAIHVDIHGGKGMALIGIIDMQGRVVKTEINNNTNSIIDTRSMPSGNYNLIITDADKKKEVHQILIQH